MKKKMLHEYTLKELLIEGAEPAYQTPDQGIGIEWDFDASAHSLDGSWYTKINNNMTIGEFQEWLRRTNDEVAKGRAREGDRKMLAQMASFIADTAAGEIFDKKKYYDFFKGLFDIGRGAYSGPTGKSIKGYDVSKIPDAQVRSLWRNFPALDTFDLHPHLFSVLDDHVLYKIETDYTKYLKTLPQDTKLKDVEDINDWVQDYLRQAHLVDVEALEFKREN